MRQNLLEVLRHLVEKELTQNAGLDQQEVAGANRKIALDSVAYRVLVAEDNLINQDVVKTILEKNGHQVEVVGTGIKVLEKLKTSQYDLVLMDVQMPEMDGMTATAEIRKGLEGTKNPDIPIVALTANALKGEAEKCLAAGMDGYLTKPLTLDRLREAIERWMKAPSDAAPAAVGPAGRGPIDRAVIAQMFGDNPAMVARVLARFRDAGAKLLDEIGAASDEPRRLTELAHKLKGAARAAGAVRLGDLAAALEQSGNAEDAAPLREEWRQVEAALSAS